MKKIEISVPETVDTKDWMLSFCVSYLKNLIWWDKQLKWSLKPLWDIELISMNKLLKQLNSMLGREYTMDDLSYHIRWYERSSWKKIRPIKKYKDVSDTKVFLVEDLDWLKLYLLWLE